MKLNKSVIVYFHIFRVISLNDFATEAKSIQYEAAILVEKLAFLTPAFAHKYEILFNF